MLGRLIAGVGVGYACWRVLHRRRLSRPIFSIGLVADVQAANKPDGFGEARVQRYALAFAKLEQAVTAWLERQLACVLSLGDIVDGNHHPRATRDDLARVLGQFRRCQSTCEVHHVLGNHCLQDLPRTELLGELGMRGSYYRVQIAPGWYLLALDTTDLSLHGGWAPSSAISRESEAYAAAHSDSPRVQRWNGGVGCAQREWLRAQLDEADAEGARLIVASHHALAPGAARETHSAWNGQAVADMCVKSPAFAIGLSGHDHVGGCVVWKGKPFVTLEAMLEAPLVGNAYGVMHVYRDRIVIDGCGTAVTSRCFEI